MNNAQALRRGVPIYIAAMSMRSGMTVMNPLISIFKSEYHLSAFRVSFLSSLPLLCFAGAGLLMSLVRRIGTTNRIVAVALMTITSGISVRMFGSLPVLFVSVVAVGVGIAVLNFTLPVWVKEEAPEHSGLLTGVYITIMGIFASLAVASAAPLARLTSWGWRLSMVPWMALGIFSSLWWLNMNRRKNNHASQVAVLHFHPRFFKSPDAWAIAVFFGLQSMLFYGTASWLPSILVSKGYSLNAAGYAVSLTGLMGSVVGVLAPHYASTFKHLRAALFAIGLMITVAFGAMIIDHGWHLIIWLFIANIGLAVSFPISLLLTVLRGSSAGETRSLSIMSQSFGYLMAAFAPGLVGATFDATHNWNQALLLPAGFGIALGFVGLIAGREGKI